MLNKIVMKKTLEKQNKEKNTLSKLSSLLYSEKIKQNPEKKKKKYLKHSKMGLSVKSYKN